MYVINVVVIIGITLLFDLHKPCLLKLYSRVFNQLIFLFSPRPRGDDQSSVELTGGLLLRGRVALQGE